MLEEARCKGGGNEQRNPLQKWQGKTTPLSLVCSHPECCSFRVVYGMRSRRGRKRRQSLHTSNRKTELTPVLHSSCFQSTATTSQNCAFFGSEERSGCSCILWVLPYTGTPGSAHSREGGLQSLTAAPAAKESIPWPPPPSSPAGLHPTAAACPPHRPSARSVS